MHKGGLTGNDYKQYSPGFHKLVHHLDHLSKIKKGEVVGPIHVSFFPTNFCQLQCDYCCFNKTVRTSDELSYSDFQTAIDVLKKYGLKAAEISGGGEPLMWTYFDPAVEYAHSKGLKLSLITNGLDLEKKSKEILGKFNWIRASVQSVKYAESINLKHVPSTVKTSMSYIVYDKKGIDEIKYLYQFSRDTNTIIRVGPKRPCTKSWEKTVENEVKSYGFPLLFFSKEAGSPAGCFMAYIRGAIDWKGNFLPCPSIELSPEFAGRIPNSFALCKISELEDWLINNPPHDLGYICSFCNCGKDTNDFIYNLLKNVEDEDFV